MEMVDIKKRKRAFFFAYGFLLVGILTCAWFLSSWQMALASVLAAAALIDYEVGVQLLFPYLGFFSILLASVAFIHLGWNFFLVCISSAVLLLAAIGIALFYQLFVLQRR